MDIKDDVDAMFMVMRMSVVAVWPCSVLFPEVGWLSIGSHHIFADDDDE